MIKLRTIAYHNKGQPVKGLTVPDNITLFYKQEQKFSVERSGNCIVYYPGSEIVVTQEQIINYKFEGYRV